MKAGVMQGSGYEHTTANIEIRITAPRRDSRRDVRRGADVLVR